MALVTTLKARTQALVPVIGARWRGLLGTGILALIAAIVAGRRRSRASTIALPEPAGIAAETATSVHNAAKSTVMAAVREADHADTATVTASIREAVADAADAGADITSVAIGSVEGAVEVAHLLGVGSHELASAAAQALVVAASERGAIAGERVVVLLGDLLDDDAPVAAAERRHA